MRRVLALDISTKLGWALLEYPELPTPITIQDIKILEYGKITLTKPVKEWGKYPYSYVWACQDIAKKVGELFWSFARSPGPLGSAFAGKIPDIVIEETNGGSRAGRFTQKMLEMLHFAILYELEVVGEQHLIKIPPRVYYLSSSEWRNAIGIGKSKEDKKNNRKLSQAKSRAKLRGEKLDKEKLGIKGKVGWKHLSVRWVNETWGLDFKMKQNDEADAIGQAVAFALGTRSAYFADTEIKD